MKVSIITISYNSAETIEDTIRSVVSQSYPDIEYIIVDGKSTDATMSIVERYNTRIDKAISEPDKGLYDAMNKGIRMATGDIIGVLNSDDFYCDEHVIRDMVQLFERTKCDGAYADLLYVHRNDTTRIVRTWKAGQYTEGKFLRGWMPPHPTFFVKAEVYHKYGLFNTAFRSAADYEIMLRFIHKHCIRIAYLPRVITHMRTGGQSNVSLRNRIKANMEDRLAWKVNGLRPGLFTLTRKPLSKIVQYFRKK